jgi:hypothetical protein
MYGRGNSKVLEGVVELRTRPLLAYVCILMLKTIYCLILLQNNILYRSFLKYLVNACDSLYLVKGAPLGF